MDGVGANGLRAAVIAPCAAEKNEKSPLGWILILLPILIVAVCFAHASGLIVLPQGLRVAIVFALLLALMLTGMPISIALGLTVLSFMFTLTDVRTESVALKLFTGIESFEIMAIPFFILAGNFLTHGGVARRMIAFATAMVGHWYGGLALAAGLACALFAAIFRSSPATDGAVRSVILPAVGAQGVSQRFCAGVFTPTEAAAVSAVYAFIVAVFIYKDLKLRDVPKVLLASANLSAMLLYIITNAVLFSFLMTYENVPHALAQWMIDQGFGWIGFLLVVNLLLLMAGNVMEPSSIILIMAPILFPVAVKLWIAPPHFRLLMTANKEDRLCPPPVRLNL